MLLPFLQCNKCAGLPAVQLLQQNGGGVSKGGGHSDGIPQEGQQGLQGCQGLACMPWVACFLQLLVAAHQQCADCIAS